MTELIPPIVDQMFVTAVEQKLKFISVNQQLQNLILVQVIFTVSRLSGFLTLLNLNCRPPPLQQTRDFSQSSQTSKLSFMICGFLLQPAAFLFVCVVTSRALLLRKLETGDHLLYEACVLLALETAFSKKYPPLEAFPLQFFVPNVQLVIQER